MTLRQKTMAVVVATLTVMIGSLYLVSQTVMPAPFAPLWVTLVAGVLSGTAILLFLEKAVLSKFAGLAAFADEMRDGLMQSRQQLAKTQEILESVTDPFVAMDNAGVLTYVNPAASQLLSEGGRQLVLGEKLWELLPESTDPRLREECESASAAQIPAQFEMSYPALDGWFAVHVSPYLDGVSIHFRDISERKRLEEQLLRAHRLETAGRIAGQVAHDFNNLLGPLSAYPELIKMQLPPDHPAAQYCEDMLEAAERMAYINEEMMTLGRRGRVEQQPTDLNRVVRQAVEEIEVPSESLKVRLDLTPDLPTVNGSAAQLVRVVSNLVANARDAMQGVGSVTLKTDRVVVKRPVGSKGRRESREYVRLSVADTGCGIPLEIRDRIFEAFFTTKDRTKRRGCGLGLSIVQNIVEDHKGFMELESEVGHGTTFMVCLPACGDAVRAARPRSGMVGGSERVLVVDDDRLQREVSRELLETLGYHVEVAASSEEAIARLKEYAADLLVLDMVLETGCNGAETYRRVLEMKPHQRAILISGFAESDQVKEALALGAGAYLRKPVTLEKLAKAVREELDRQN